MSQRLFYIYYICPRQDCQVCSGGFCYIFSAYKMQYVFKSVFAKSKRAQEPTFLRSFFWCGRWDFPAGQPTVHWTVGSGTSVPSPCSDLRCPNQAARLVPLAFFDRRACSGSLYPPQAAVAFAASPQLRIPNKNPHGGVRHGDLCLVRKMGLEPTRHRHTHLKRACLPIPALPQIAFDCKKDSSTFGGIKSSPIL